MPRTSANNGFRRLLARKSREWGEPVQLADVAASISCTRQALGAYVNARRALPYIEARLAAFFLMSVPVLRRHLGLAEHHNNNQEGKS